MRVLSKENLAMVTESQTALRGEPPRGAALSERESTIAEREQLLSEREKVDYVKRKRETKSFWECCWGPAGYQGTMPSPRENMAAS